VNRLSYVLLLFCALLCARRGAAATVGILRPASDAQAIHEARFRLQGELVAIGLAVTTVDRPPDEGTSPASMLAWFDRTSSERSIDAFIDVIGDNVPEAANVWLCERSPRRVRMFRVVVEPNAENAPATLALRTIEVLRSSFLAIDLAGSAPARAPVPPEPRLEPANSPPAHVARFGLEAGATALTSFDGVGSALLPLVRIDWAVRSWFAVQATGAGFGTRPRVDTAAGSVLLTQAFGLVGLCLCSASGTGIHPLFALSIGALRTTVDGRASAPNLGHEVDRWTALVDASAGARLSLPGGPYFTLASELQLAAPYVAIHVLDEVAATSGRPNLLFTLTAGVRL
jgi:hypothetical protein